MQTWALLVDSYRLLMSRKLFWITLAISAVVVLIFASIGFDETGWYLLFGIWDTLHFESDTIQAGTIGAENFYRGIFSGVIVEYWFTFVATILALVSTASIFTDFMSEGAIDVTLSKPISRIHVFTVKYFGSLLFVLAQVGVFCLGVLGCFAWRLGIWEWKVLLAIPIVMLFYSYLYSVLVCLSIITRSTLAALLLTILCWPVLAGIQWAEKGLAAVKVMERLQAEASIETMEAMEARRSGARVTVSTHKTDSATPADSAKSKESAESKRRRFEEQKEKHRERADNIEVWQNRVQYVLAVLPKTQDTVGLLQRWILVKDDQGAADEENGAQKTAQQIRREQQGNLERELTDEFNSRSPYYIIGTSLAFEFVVLAFGCFLFIRRDF